MNKKILFIPLIVFIIVIVALLVQLARNANGDDPHKLESALIGRQIPTFQLAQLDPKLPKYSDKDLLSHHQVVLINVWATWCPTCYAEHSYLNLLAQQGVPIIGINFKDDRQAALSWLYDKGNPYQTVLFDNDGMTGLDFGVYGAPETFLVDQEGIIRYRHAGNVNDEIWKKDIQPLYLHYQQQKVAS